MLSLLMLVVPQEAAPSPSPRPAAPEVVGTRFDDRGWPIVETPPAQPDLEVATRTRTTPRSMPATAPAAVAADHRDNASSSLEATFAAVGSARAFRSLGGLTIWWRVTVHGPQGETIGIREVTHFCDPSTSDRDRLEFADGRVCGRLGPTVFAERHGLPWPTLVEASTQDLALFGIHARLPWVFADQQAYSEVAATPAGSDPAGGARVRLRQRTEDGRIGPDPEPRQLGDQFELGLPASGAVPSEFVQQFVCSGERRRVLLEDWRPVGAVTMPFRRIYVDGAGRPTTTLVILRVEPGQAVAERDFRLH